MIWQIAQVVNCNADRLIVRISAPQHCRRCARGEGCGAGVFARLFSRRETRLALPADASYSAGDWVRLGLRPQALALGAARHYGLALLGLLAGAGAGHVFVPVQGLQDPAALLGGLLGLMAAVGLAGKRPKGALNPVVERLSCPETDAKSFVSTQ